MSTFSHNVRHVQNLSAVQLTDAASDWHKSYRQSAYISIGGLDLRLTEGDVVVVFSQWGEVVNVNLVRDKKTGKPKGFAFLAYADQRSTDLAVDNSNGMLLKDRTLRVDHVRDYKAPIILHPTDRDEDGNPIQIPYKATGAEGGGIGVYGITRDEQEKIGSQSTAPQAGRLTFEDPDEAWAREFAASLKEEEEVSRGKEHRSSSLERGV